MRARKLKIESSGQIRKGRTDEQTKIVTPRAPVGAKNVEITHCIYDARHAAYFC